MHTKLLTFIQTKLFIAQSFESDHEDRIQKGYSKGIFLERSLGLISKKCSNPKRNFLRIMIVINLEKKATINKRTNDQINPV
jgi:hypothetical protein